MKVFRAVLVACVVGLAGMTAGAGPARAASVTIISEIDNQTSGPLYVYNLEDHQKFTIAPGDKWPGTTWVPWVSSDAEMWGKNIIIRSAHHDYYVFQDYSDPGNAVKYSENRRYQGAVALSGGTGGGVKILVVNSDEALSMTNVPRLPLPPQPYLAGHRR